MSHHLIFAPYMDEFPCQYVSGLIHALLLQIRRQSIVKLWSSSLLLLQDLFVLLPLQCDGILSIARLTPLRPVDLVNGIWFRCPPLYFCKCLHSFEELFLAVRLKVCWLSWCWPSSWRRFPPRFPSSWASGRLCQPGRLLHATGVHLAVVSQMTGYHLTAQPMVSMVD